MSAYIVFIRDKMKDEDIFTRYSAKSKEARGDHPLTPLVYYGAITTLEGDEADGAVIAKFPTIEAARAWYYSDKYQEALALRKQAADYRVILVEGID
jgi:uncharacterized protein (DUF1330 family)